MVYKSSTVARYAAGPKVYKGGTNAPTRGTVDPAGYVQREAQKRSQQLQQQQASDSRSGLAAAALRRSQSAPAQATAVQAQAQSGYNPRQAWKRYVPPAKGGTKKITPVRNTPYNPPTQPPKTQPNPVGRIEWAPQNEELKNALAQFTSGQAPDNIQAIIQLLGKESVRPYTGDTSLGFDAEAADAAENLYGQRSRLLMDLMRQAQGIERGFADQSYLLDQQMPEQLRGLLNDYADRGLAFSSGYVHDVGNTEQQFNWQKSNLADSRTQGLLALIQDRMAADDDYARNMAMIQRGAARRLAERPDEIDLPGTPNMPTPPPTQQPVTQGNWGSNSAETPEQALQRMVQQVMSGQRTLNQIRTSFDLKAGLTPQQYSHTDKDFLGDPALLAQRIRDIARNRGIQGY